MRGLDVVVSAGTELDISVVLPVYNEEENLEPLVRELDRVLGSLGRSFEIICVNDCSTDGSADAVRRLAETRPHVRLVNHRINSGESAAFVSGFHIVRGSIVITMDADQQNDPADIPALIGALGPGVACVCGVRRKRNDNFVRRASSRIANRFRDFVTGDHISDAGCTYRAIRTSALAELPVFNGLHRFLPTILRYQGFKVVEIDVNHRPRTRGVSKYGIGNRLWRGLRDCFAMRWFRARAVRGDRIEIPGQ